MKKGGEIMQKDNEFFTYILKFEFFLKRMKKANKIS